jgi:hypothetical protein
MIPVMFVGKVWFGRSYLVSQYLATVLLLIGIILFSLADVTVDTDFQMIGIHLMITAFHFFTFNHQYFIEALLRNSVHVPLYFCRGLWTKSAGESYLSAQLHRERNGTLQFEDSSF